MPELPEVETVVRQLQQKIVGKTITKLNIIDQKVVDQNITKILPTKILAVSRRAKAIIVHLENDDFLVIHLRMTGHFYVVEDSSTDYQKYLAGIFYFSNTHFFTYNTIRRFGTVTLMNKKQLDLYLQKHGPEPLEISEVNFVKILKKFPAANIKNKLLDQKMIAGIGNIYAQEALYHAGINPHRQIYSISKQKLTLLHQQLQRILQLAIQNNGTTMQNYSHLNGKGDFQDLLAVYHREKCPQQHFLTKAVIAGRGTYFCKKCQK